MNTSHELKSLQQVDRRRWLSESLAGVGIGSSLLAADLQADVSDVVADTHRVPGPDYRVTRGCVRQSVMAWCFRPLPMETLIPACGKMGLVGMEGIDKKYYPLMKRHGLAVSLCGSHSFGRGPINRDNHAFCQQKLRDGIDLAVEWNSPGVITFTGMRESAISDEKARQNCVDCWKSACKYAEEKEVNIVLEMLNTRDSSHPMKGHPGYFGDDLDLCIDLIRAVDSPRMKLLFDIYHVQVMHGDVIRRFREHQDWIAHVHTAGNPGRGELDATQELNYPAIVAAILETSFDGYIAQEFIPTWDDKLAALRHAVRLCDL